MLIVHLFTADYKFRLSNVGNSSFTYVPRRHFNSRPAYRYTGIGGNSRRESEIQNTFGSFKYPWNKKDPKPTETEKIKTLLSDETLTTEEKQRLKARLLPIC